MSADYKFIEEFHDADCRWKCLLCGREFPYRYEAKRIKRKRYGTKQLMKIYARSNFFKHMKACRTSSH